MTHKWMVTLLNGHCALRQRPRNFPEHLPAAVPPFTSGNAGSRSRDEILEAIRSASTFGAHEHAAWLIAAIESVERDVSNEGEDDECS